MIQDASPRQDDLGSLPSLNVVFIGAISEVVLLGLFVKIPPTNQFLPSSNAQPVLTFDGNQTVTSIKHHEEHCSIDCL